MSVTLSQISISEFFDDPSAEALLAEYADECALAGLPPPVPHRDIYLALERAGVVSMFGARVDGVLVGFIVLLTSMNPHYSVVLGAVESFFVAAAHRKSGAGVKLLREARRAAKDRGAVGLLVSAPFGGKLAAVLKRSKRFDLTNEVFCEVL